MSDDVLARLRAITDQLMDPELFRQMLDALPDALLVITSKQEIVLVNRQTELFFGHPRDALLGKDVSMLLPENLRERHQNHIRTFFNDPQITTSHRRLMNLGNSLPGLRADGTIIKLQISLGPLVSSLGIWGLALIRKAVLDAN